MKLQIPMSLDSFKDFYLPKIYNENMFLKNGNLNPKYNSHKKTGLLAQIFEDHGKIFILQTKSL